MRARGTARNREAENSRPPARTSVDRVATPLPSLLALQRSAGNAAVVRMLRQAGHPGAQEGRRDGSDREPQQAEQPMRRSRVHDVLRAPGRPLDDGTRTEMEARLGADLSDVRLHTGPAARASAAEVDARAYTSGSHVVIGEQGSDKHTLAHELTHVIQQRKGPVAGTENGNGLRISDPSDRFEREAEANATRVMRAPMSRQHLAAEHLAAEHPGERRDSDNSEQTRPGGRTLARKRSVTVAAPVVQRMPLDEFNTQVSDAYTAQDTGQQHAGRWSKEQWLRRFRQWFAAQAGVAEADLDSHITEKVTAGDLAAGLDAFGPTAREFAHVASMGELDAPFAHEGATFAPGARGANLSMNTRRPFWQWLQNEGPEPLRMNCWEAVLYAAAREQLIDKAYVRKAIKRGNSEAPPEFALRILNSPTGQLEEKNEHGLVDIAEGESIPPGYVVIFGPAEHVALSTGEIVDNKSPARGYGAKGHGVYELDSGATGIVKTTIEDVIGQRLMYGQKKLTWGRLPNLD